MMVLSPSSDSPPRSSCRVISAEAKTDRHQDNSRISGWVEMGGGELRWARVADGSLAVGLGPGARPLWRLPLRHLNLQPSSPLGLAFSLTTSRENHTIASFKVKTEAEYERWVKAVAAELMRQTPLDSVRFLDILGITGSLALGRRSRSAECLSSSGAAAAAPPDLTTTGAGGRRDSAPRSSSSSSSSCQRAGLPPCLRYRKRLDLPDVVRDLPPCDSRKSRLRQRDGRSGVDGGGGPDERRSCWRRLAESSASVKEKASLFEALLSGGDGGGGVRRATSLLDLPSSSASSASSSSTPPPLLLLHLPHVRDMARLFERRATDPNPAPVSQRPGGAWPAPQHSLDPPKHRPFQSTSDSPRYLRSEEEPRGRKQFSLPDIKMRHHSNIR